MPTSSAKAWWRCIWSDEHDRVVIPGERRETRNPGRAWEEYRPAIVTRLPVDEWLAIAGVACHNNCMGAITFATLKFTKRLKEAGFTEPQAEAIADSFLQATGEAEVATKRDLERLEAKLVGELTLMKWMLGVLLGGVLALVLKTFFPS